MSKPSQTEALYASSKVNAAKLAGGISMRITNEQSCIVDAIGAASQYQALTALVIARGYLQKTTHASVCLAFEPLKVNVDATETTPQTAKVRFHARLHQVTLEDLSTEEAKFSGKVLTLSRTSNAGRHGREIARKFAGNDAMQSGIGGIGMTAFSKALATLLYANRFLQEDAGQGHRTIWAVPALLQSKDGMDERTRFLLHCFCGQ